MLSGVTSAITPSGVGISKVKNDFQSLYKVLIHRSKCTLEWNKHCPCHTHPLMFTSSGYHGDGVICVTLEASESGLICCWVTELQGGLITSLRMICYSGGVEAARSWV